nr:pentatricopeptide repeat-containing protein At4g21065 [Ipomoea trifida]
MAGQLRSMLNYKLCKPCISLVFQTKKSLSLFIKWPLWELTSAYSSAQIPTKTNNSECKSYHSSREQKYLFLFKKCSTTRGIEQVHAQIIQAGLTHSLYLLGKIIAFCAISEQGSMGYAVSVFEHAESSDGFLWNTMIRGFVRTGEVERAIEYYKRMLENGVVADNFTFSFLLKLCGQSGLDVLGKQLHSSVVKSGQQSHVFVLNTLIHMYGMLKDVEVADQLFEEIPQPGLVAWNTIIDCHMSCGEHAKALHLFERMQKCGVGFDEATLVVTLSACSEMGALDYGRWLHFLVDKSSLSRTLQVCNSLIDMYAKCGEVEEAYRVFNRMKVRNLVTWNTMILGYAIHGNGDEALKLFSRMLNEKQCFPNDVTFLGALCACSHGGMVEEGKRYFHIMIHDFHIQPTLKHYGCMVDVLARAGFVQEAYDLITSMPGRCNAVIWRTLLGACRVHGKVELAEEIRSHLQQDHSSDYVLLSNVYASAGLWNNFIEARKSMRDRGVQKPVPGNSLIKFIQE